MSQTTHACWRWRRQVTLLASSALEAAALPRVQAHLDSCPRCRELFGEIAALNTGLRNLGSRLPSLEPSSGWHQRWRESLVASQPTRRKSAALRSGSGAGYGERIVEWLQPNPKWWPALAGCWVLIVFLRVLSPGISVPPPSNACPPLNRVLSVLRPADATPTSPPILRKPEGALVPEFLEPIVLAFRPSVALRDLSGSPSARPVSATQPPLA